MQYAGNVLVYGGGLAASGDWFGGLNAGNAASFLSALLACKADKGAAGDRALRPWWRGRVGLSKDAQKELWAGGLKDIEDL